MPLSGLEHKQTNKHSYAPFPLPGLNEDNIKDVLIWESHQIGKKSASLNNGLEGIMDYQQEYLPLSGT